MNKLTLVQFQYSHSVPLAALYLAQGLKKENIPFDLKLYPKIGLTIDIDRLYSFLAQSKEILAIGCWSNVLPYLIVALERLKKKFPEKIIILGGIGPAEVAQELIRQFHFIDFIIKGCGVSSLPKLIKAIVKGEEDSSDISGLVYRNRHTLISNDYNALFPNRSTYNTVPYFENKQITPYNEFYVKTSFGCPYQCTFCQISNLGHGKVVYRNMDKILDEIQLIKEVKKERKFSIIIADEVFNLNRKRIIEFCNLMRARKLNIPWSCNCRVNLMDEDLLEVMARSGCNFVYYGIESGSNRILEKTRKGFPIEEAIKTLLLSRKYICEIIASFIYLYPFETREDFLDTSVIIRYLWKKGISTQLHPLNPIKGSEIYREYKGDLILLETLPNPCHEPIKNMPFECQKIIREHPDIFYFYYSYNSNNLKEILSLQRQQKLALPTGG